MLKGNKFRIYPTEKQKEMLEKHFGASRFIYNKLLDIKKTIYTQYRGKVSRIDLGNHVQVLKEIYPWLKDVYSHSLLSANNNLDRAYANFFKNGLRYPKFKSKKDSNQSFQMSDLYQIDVSHSKIYIPIIGWVKIVLHRDLFSSEFTSTHLKFSLMRGKETLRHTDNKEFLRTLTVSKTASGKYFASIVTEDLKEPPQQEVFSEESTIGVDVGIKDFAVLSTGEKIENPMFLKESLPKLKVLQRRLSRKQNGSNNFKKAKLKLAKLHEKISNRRNDFQHKVSIKLIRENQAIALETLTIQNMLRNHKLAQAIGDSAWNSFVLKLEYKAENFGKTILKIGKFAPSSKTCSVCGHKNNELTLSIREWTCSYCNSKHDRDVNAAINIKYFALNSFIPGTGSRAYGSMNNSSRYEVGSPTALA